MGNVGKETYAKRTGMLASTLTVSAPFPLLWV
jgi:hypothetical protein